MPFGSFTHLVGHTGSDRLSIILQCASAGCLPLFAGQSLAAVEQMHAAGRTHE